MKVDHDVSVISAFQSLNKALFPTSGDHVMESICDQDEDQWGKRVPLMKTLFTANFLVLFAIYHYCYFCWSKPQANPIDPCWSESPRSEGFEDAISFYRVIRLFSIQFPHDPWNFVSLGELQNFLRGSYNFHSIFAFQKPWLVMVIFYNTTKNLPQSVC